MIITMSLPIPFDGCRPYHLLPFLRQTVPTKIVPKMMVVWNSDEDSFYQVDEKVFMSDIALPEDPVEAPGIYVARGFMYYAK